MSSVIRRKSSGRTDVDQTALPQPTI